MPVAAFDTYTAAKTLRAAGFDENQAEAAVTVIRDAVAESTVTKADLQAGLAELRADMADLRADLKADMAATYVTKADFAAGLATLRAEMRGDLLRAVLALGAMMIVGFGAMLALLTTLLP